VLPPHHPPFRPHPQRPWLRPPGADRPRRARLGPRPLRPRARRRAGGAHRRRPRDRRRRDRRRPVRPHRRARGAARAPRTRRV
ncbi:MAG: hypothetical protein AVDCRST_MAG11-3113, partial [uncultured Gemmatimonadaceae bacterium]